MTTTKTVTITTSSEDNENEITMVISIKITNCYKDDKVNNCNYNRTIVTSNEYDN